MARHGLGKQLRYLTVQIGAVRQLHANRDGVCAYCGTTYPCDTRAVMQTARKVVDVPAKDRAGAKAASRAAVDEILAQRAADLPEAWCFRPSQDVETIEIEQPATSYILPGRTDG